MYGKILIQSDLEVKTGLHIGGSNVYAAIGAVNNPIIRNPRDNHPIIPGSSLKGKIRILLEREAKRCGKGKEKIRRLFGSAATKNAVAEKSRLQFSDCFVINADATENVGLTEIKMENTIDRKKGEAKPRSVERVCAGTKFQVNIVYDCYDLGDNSDESKPEQTPEKNAEKELKDDLQELANGMRLLEFDYLGGYGTRGSGRVKFSNIRVTILDLNQSNSNVQKDTTNKNLENELKNCFSKLKEAALFE